jgi:hypothetical protein
MKPSGIGRPQPQRSLPDILAASAPNRLAICQATPPIR